MVRRRLRSSTGAIEEKQNIRRRTRRRPPPQPRADILAHDNDNSDVLIPCISGAENGQFRGGDYLHVSDLIYKCTRKIAVADKFGMPMPDEPIFPSQGLTFAQGHAIGDYIVNRVKQKTPSMLYGKFACTCGDLVMVGRYSQIRRGEHECEVCNTAPDNYREVTLINDELMLVGNVDLMLDMDGHLHICELKSIAGHHWEELTRPKPEHRVQTLIYWWMARELGLPLVDKASILYASKAFSMKSPYKEFVIHPSEELNFIEEHLEEAREWGQYKSGGALPARVTCIDEDAPQARKCHVCTQCFQT